MFMFVFLSVQCNQGEFECNDHKCIPQTNRCDGMPQCDDRSDEFRCGE